MRKQTPKPPVVGKYANRKISREDASKLHPGMQRLAKLWNWTIVDQLEPGDPTNITLFDLGLAPPAPAPEPEPEEDNPPDRLLPIGPENPITGVLPPMPITTVG